MIFLDLVNLKKIRRVILYLACIAVTLTAQNTVFSHVAPLGVRAFFIPALITVIGLFEGGSWGAFLGLAAGILTDLSLSGSVVTFTLLLPLLGFVSGLLTEFYINKRFFSCLVLSVLGLAAAALVQSLPLWFLHGSSLPPLLLTAALQTLWSAPFAVPLYFVCRAIAGMD